VLGKTDLSEFFTQHLEPIDLSSVKISSNLINWLVRYKKKKKVFSIFFKFSKLNYVQLGATAQK